MHCLMVHYTLVFFRVVSYSVHEDLKQNLTKIGRQQNVINEITE
jgi:hypothetical protein